MDERDDEHSIFGSIFPGTEHYPTVRTSWPTLGCCVIIVSALQCLAMQKIIIL